MPSNHAQQKKALKHKKKREAARQKARESTRLVLHPTQADVLKMAVGRPFGPVFISDDWDVIDEALPRLVTVVVSRRAPGHLLVAGLALVDRTCLGVKNAIVFPPLTEAELDERLDAIGRDIGGLRRVEPLVAQSVVYHAIDFARALGFAPNPDFAEVIFGPRPAALVDTPLGKPARPNYVTGPDDEIGLVLEKLIAAVGPDGFDVTGGFSPDAGLLDMGLDEDELDDEDEEPLDDEDEAAGELPEAR